MSFFDSKEEVINIELTQYGKEIFAKGKFQPEYYAFFDEDIIYDMKYAGFSEIENKIEERILEKSIFLKAFPTLTGSYDDSKKIGTCDYINEYIPSLKLNILEGATISSSVYVDKYPNILQINLNSSKIQVTGDSFDTLNVSVDNILLDIEEINTAFNKENFEISLYEVNDNNLKYIPFGEEQDNVKNGILLDKINNFEIPENNPECAEYYFSFTRDKKINKNILNNLNNKLDNIYK